MKEQLMILKPRSGRYFDFSYLLFDVEWALHYVADEVPHITIKTDTFNQETIIALLDRSKPPLGVLIQDSVEFRTDLPGKLIFIEDYEVELLSHSVSTEKEYTGGGSEYLISPNSVKELVSDKS